MPQSLAAGSTQCLEWFLPDEWPSIMLAFEILAWGFFFGLACLSLAPRFRSHGLERVIFWVLMITRLLALMSAVGQVISSVLLSLAGPLA